MVTDAVATALTKLGAPRHAETPRSEVDVQGDVMQRRLIRTEDLGFPLHQRPLAGVEEGEGVDGRKIARSI